MRKYLVALLVFSLLIAGSVLAYTTIPEARKTILVYETPVGDIELDPFTARHLIDDRGRGMALIAGGIPAGTDPKNLKKYLEGEGVNEEAIKGFFVLADRVVAPVSPGMSSWSEIAPLFVKALEGGKVQIVEVSFEDPMFWVGYTPNRGNPIREVAILDPHYWACKETLRVYEVQDIVVGDYRLCLGFMEPCGNLIFLGSDFLEPESGVGQKGSPQEEELVASKPPIRRPFIEFENWVGPSFGSP